MIEKSFVPLEGGRPSGQVEGTADLPSNSGEVRDGRPQPQIPDEPFLCPECGQLLGPSARVCAACKQPVDPAKVRQPVVVAANNVELSQSLVRRQSEMSARRVPFPWQLVVLFVGLRFLMLSFAGRHGGLAGPMGMATMLVEFVTSLWVIFDGYRQGVRSPLRWGLCSFLMWPVVFPWYLVRRRVPKDPCPFVEGKGIVITLLVVMLAICTYVVIHGPEKGSSLQQEQVPNTRPPSR